MAQFMDVHDGFVGVTHDELSHAHDADLEIEGEEGVHFEKAWLDPESGKRLWSQPFVAKAALTTPMAMRHHAAHLGYTAARHVASASTTTPTPRIGRPRNSIVPLTEA